jgi:DNA-binding CsgD family transcriptional regulator
LSNRIDSLVRNGVAVRVTHRMIKDVVNSCGDDFDKYRGYIETRKFVKWKNDLSGLLVLNDSDIEYLSGVSKRDYNEELSKLLAIKKRDYSIRALAMVKRSTKISQIYNAMLAMREVDGFVTIRGVSQLTGIPESTISQYVGHFSDMISDLSFIDGRGVRSDVNLKRLESEISKMKADGVKITKQEVHKRTNISRPTINKHWGKLIHLIK